MTIGDGTVYEQLTNHEERIINLEAADKRHEEELRTIKNNYTNLENTILKENRDTFFFQDTMNKQWELISTKSKYDDIQSQRDYDLRKTKIERYSEMLLKFAGRRYSLYPYSIINKFGRKLTMTADKLKQYVAMIGGVLGTLLLFFRSIDHEIAWFNEVTIESFIGVLLALIPLVLVFYGIYKNQYLISKKAKGQEEYLKRGGWK